MSTEQTPPTIDAKVLETTVDIHVFNSDGGMVRFGDIFADQKTVVVFIREHTNPACVPICLPLTALFILRAFFLWGKASWLCRWLHP